VKKKDWLLPSLMEDHRLVRSYIPYEVTRNNKDVDSTLSVPIRYLRNISALDLADLIRGAIKQADKNQAKAAQKMEKELKRFMKEVADEVKLEKWAEKENHCYPLGPGGLVPPPMQFDEEGNFKLSDKVTQPVPSYVQDGLSGEDIKAIGHLIKEIIQKESDAAERNT